MINILLEGLDNETRIKLLPNEQEAVKSWNKMGLS